MGNHFFRIISCRGWLLLLAMLVLNDMAQAQTDPGAPKRQRIDVDHADVLQVQQREGSSVQRLVGNVALSQDSIYMYCDSATLENAIRLFALGNVTIQQGDSLSTFADSLYYNAERREAELLNNVVLINGDRRLYTNRLHYNLRTKIATYASGATITNGQTQLSSRRGYYYVDERTVFFRGDVVVIDPRFEMRADTLEYDAGQELVYFHGPTIFRSDSSEIYCEDGFYDVRRNVAEFRRNAQYQKGDQRATADVIRYDGPIETYTLDGNARFAEGGERLATADLIRYDQLNQVTQLMGDAFFRDSVRTIRAEQITYDARRDVYTTTGRSLISDPPNLLEADAIDYRDELGLGIAKGNVIWRDTSADLTILAEDANYNQQTGYLKASGGARGRPLLINVIDGDSLYLAADTLLSLRAESAAGDSSRLLFAYHDVRIFKSDLQALADSLSYSTADSIFRLFRDPILWSDTSQFVADTVDLLLANQQLDQIFLRQRAFIITSPDLQFFNQIKGKTINARFDSNELRRMLVEGNAEAIYYAQDDDGAYVGVNKTACSAMTIDFDDNQVTSILFRQAPSGRLDPMGAVNHNTFRLEGFRWETDIRPQSIDSLFGPPPRRVEAAPPAELSKREGGTSGQVDKGQVDR